MASPEAAALLKRFYALQEERVETYRLFDQGYAAYLQSAPNYNFPFYRQLVHNITQTFKKISEEMIENKCKLVSEHNREDVAKYIDKIQEEEKKKLELTAKLQLAKQNAVDKKENAASYQAESTELKQQIVDVVERINEHMEELKYEAEDLLSVASS
ncbi:hypothetical protein CAPTEDRAFT_213404 [Capitella teleta]|uniref:Uncharacterized protein n=1 Tax=Capitella teleta TaxID=283909 RepID=R7UNI4_CAPTE|nr:hypothetical protein CAPTEDRAFT_213404 [Capitella teleta]|eukprot:ELU08069.1 hypothetical protein CAPTEDRAFT_213404 [Capitella teleta]